MTSTHPVDIAPQGVDFAIVHQITIGMGTLPAGEGVGAEAAVHQGQRSFYGAILHIGIEGAQLLGGEHALVHDGAGGQAGNIKIFAAAQLAIANIVFSLTTNAVQLALEGVVVDIQAV